MLEDLREEVYQANMDLVGHGLVVLTWGNASGIDRERGLVVIKPSGIDYAGLRPEHLVVVDLDGNVVEGCMRPSSDTPTHIALYRAWTEIGGVIHTHSTYGTAFAQAGQEIACYGTTHADFCPGPIPCIRGLTREEVETKYEINTGLSIIQHYEKHGLAPLEYPGAVLAHHGPFAWGRNAIEAVKNGLILEETARMAFLTKLLHPGIQAIPDYILDKHHLRKHGPGAYYGQPRSQ